MRPLMRHRYVCLSGASRNASGEILASKTAVYRVVASPFTAEAHTSANIMAHELAIEAIRSGSRTYLLGGLPE
ncbi:hypothetical protein J1N35_007213 [Gossypium stocksii]|uniref:Uncharacterized protein n=1 Tax=Gossypium stocksii TaxID=47602 RepID=A0A9D4AFD4_9ROSI|nr:hypothetical protein J1N35_007213 [Gossypium stocksii]